MDQRSSLSPHTHSSHPPIPHPSLLRLSVPARLLIAMVFIVFILVSKFYVAFTSLFVVYLVSGLVVQLSYLTGVRAGRKAHTDEKEVRDPK